jgi:hypothetical protein
LNQWSNDGQKEEEEEEETKGREGEKEKLQPISSIIFSNKARLFLG